MTNEAGMKVKIILHQIDTAGDLLWENDIDLVHHRNIYFWCNVYLPSVKCCSTAKQNWNRYSTTKCFCKFLSWVVTVYF